MKAPEWIPNHPDEVNITDLHPLMNDTKWDELRLSMHRIENRPQFRCKDANGFYSEPDREWFYHFRGIEYKSLIYVDILVSDPSQRVIVRTELKVIHVPGEETAEGFRVYGYSRPGQTLDYI
ncbi:DUF6678 family protein [Chelatococcus sambhunathii]|uniref:DUF6678 family protein n=1 Tax=Chelatococcus sambhunathii TaxID=363953 RepID=UPI0028529B00|nr:DUF6678 family protein [Chelatococcus sambhunathii]